MNSQIETVQPSLRFSFKEFIFSILALGIWFTPERILLTFLFLQPYLDFTDNPGLNIVKHLLLRFIAIYLFLITILSTIQSNKRINKSGLELPISLYIITAFLSSGIAIISSNAEIIDSIISLVTLPLLILLIYIFPYWFDNKKVIVYGVKIFLYSSFTVVIIGLFQLLYFSLFPPDRGFRVTSIFHDPNIFARFLLFGIYFVLSILLFSKEKILSKRFLLTFLVLSFICLLYSFSRSGYATFIVGCFVFAMFVKSKKLKAGIIISGIMVGIAAFLFLSTHRIFNGSFITEPSNFNRIQLVFSGIQMIENHWLIGIGYTNFPYIFIKSLQGSIAISLFNYEMMGYQTSIHNWLIEVWAEQGIFGLISFIWLFAAIFKKLKKARRLNNDSLLHSFLIGFTLMIFVFLFHGFFYHTFISQFFFWVFLGFLLSTIKVAENYKVT